jgi:hypothetical protein
MTKSPGRDVPLAEELETFEARRAELVGMANGQFALIHKSELVGTYQSEQDAIAEGYRRFGNVPFLVKQISTHDEPESFVSNLLAM